MRQRQALVLQLDVAQEQHVHVDRTRPVARAGEDAAELDLDRLADIEELERLEVGGDARRGVQEVGLVEDLADRLRLIERRDRLDRDAVAAEQLEGLRDVLGALADVRAKTEVARPPSIVLVFVRRLERSLDEHLDGDLLDRQRKRRLRLRRADPDPLEP